MSPDLWILLYKGIDSESSPGGYLRHMKASQMTLDATLR